MFKEFDQYIKADKCIRDASCAGNNNHDIYWELIGCHEKFQYITRFSGRGDFEKQRDIIQNDLLLLKIKHNNCRSPDFYEVFMAISNHISNECYIFYWDLNNKMTICNRMELLSQSYTLRNNYNDFINRFVDKV